MASHLWRESARLTTVIRNWSTEMECCKRKGFSELTECLEKLSTLQMLKILGKTTSTRYKQN